MAASMASKTFLPSSVSSGVAVVVWEWQNEFLRWRPYEPQVVHYIERNFNSLNNLIHLGQADPTLLPYSIDVNQMVQSRHGTGTTRPVRRSLYPPHSPAGQGVAWQWEGDTPGAWHSYDLDISSAIEAAFMQRQTQLDLTAIPFSIPYKICLQTMTQLRIETQRKRVIRRELLPVSYPPDTSKINGINTSGIVPHSSNHLLGAHHQATSQAPVPLKKRVVSDQANSGARSTSTPYSLRKKTHIPPQAPLRKAITQPVATLPSGIPGTFPFTSMSHAAMLSSSSLSQPPFNLPHGYAASSSVPGYLSSAASPFSTPPVSLHPAMTGVTNVLVSPAVPSVPPLTGYHSMPTSHSVPSLRGAYLSWPELSSRERHKIRNDFMSKKQNISAEEVLSKYITVISDIPNEEDCCICCEKLNQPSGYCSDGVDSVVYRLEKCSHLFHKLCLHQMYDCGHKDGSIQCPSCKTIYGEKCGNCPKGEMEYEIVPTRLPGYDCGTIQIKYEIRPGVQGPDHPHPGKRFSARGFPRCGFLPDNPDGRKVLSLLTIAWQRRLTFTIGQSTTTGEGDTVTWNEIHHKTEFGSNSSGHGYPDPKYIDNILMELAVHGITEQDLT